MAEAEMHDAIWISLIAGTPAILASLAAFIQSLRNSTAIRSAAEQAKTVGHVEAVRINDKLDVLNEATAKTHKMVNGYYLAAIAKISVLARRIADLTKDKNDESYALQCAAELDVARKT